MKKRLLLTLLPLAFLVAACSGAQEGIQSSSAAKSSSAAATSSAAGDTSSAADESSEPEGQEGRSAPVGIGYEIQVGDAYFELEEFGPDEGRAASYKAEDLNLTAGDEIKLYLNGEAISAWAEADKNHGVYPNYDERNPDSGAQPQTKFTVTESAIGIAYLHQNNDSEGSYSFWLTPNQTGEGGGEGGGSEGGDTPAAENAYAIYAGDTKVCDLALDGTKDYQDRDQAKATGVQLTTGQVICLKNTGTGGTWICPIEGWSFGGTSAESEAWKTYLSVGDGTWTVLQDCTVDIYAKFAWQNDSIYFGLSSTAA